MTEKVIKYRQTHKKCKYCIHLRYMGGHDVIPDYMMCDAKDSRIRCKSFPRPFCSCYTVDAENCFTEVV